jgi:SAM-dependent MidA family methyltransferase
MMLPSVNDLEKVIQAEIRTQGALSFARFWELALYCPDCGFYDRLANTIGRAGDYFTSVSVGPLFGELLAHQFARWFDATAAGGRLDLLEAGAHDGRLAVDVLTALQRHHPGAFARLEYWILEPSPLRRRVQAGTLRDFSAQVRWFESWESIPSDGVRGVIFSNELLDAMPVHRVGWDARERRWHECGVTERDGRPAWVRIPAGADVLAFLSRLHLPAGLEDALPDGFITEVGLAAEAWWRRAAAALRRGKLVTIDYGLRTEEFFRPERAGGTARAFRRHHQGRDLLANAGEQDLTAHVNFTVIQEAGESAGLSTESLSTQAVFLTGIAQSVWGDHRDAAPGSARQVSEFRTLTHPEHLGDRFRVLVQSR